MRQSKQRPIQILDQTKFEGKNDGACQTCALFGAIQDKYGAPIGYDVISKFYEDADKYWYGKCEKALRVLEYLKKFPVTFYGGKISIPKHTSYLSPFFTYEQALDMVKNNDVSLFSISCRSGFFLKTGKFSKDYTLAGFHTMYAMEKSGKLFFVNSWGSSWGNKGITEEITKEIFVQLRFIEIRACNVSFGTP